MRRLMLLLGLIMVLAVAAAGVVAAETKRCQDIPCYGTNNDDTLYERHGTVRDAIYGLDGEDIISANDFNFDRDRTFGGARGDKLLTNDGDGKDVAKGGAGHDVCFVNQGDRTRNCEEVHRRMSAEAANKAVGLP